ncbi:unnamed protein product [Hermetia illucens]|uniref:Cytidyltransferase-like domain-containing protein n=1 Tax=Hermetia illucens TaxID=343691 RepID=A0A7R8YSK6_HERIL|nr:nicotinamide/nicotinic acid mononucleotide adenylyltransferase 3-like isoform X1 [Hermetia illucens]CAD7083931.1 unnamed protein product [Hermetia illucens]
MSTSCPDVVLLSFGSYNPPTLTHFRIFEIAKDHFKQINKSRVIAGIISIIDEESDVQSEHVSLDHRKSMVNLALKSSEWIKLSDKPCRRSDPFAIRDLLQYFQNAINNITSGTTSDQEFEYPEWLPPGIHFSGKVQVKLLGGVDLFENYFRLKDKRKEEELEGVLKDHGIVIVSKSSAPCERIVFDSDLLAKNKQNITLLTNWASSEVTSSLIRRLIGRKQSVKYLLEDSVIDYIRDNNLYAHYHDSNIEPKLPESLPALQIRDITPVEQKDEISSTSGEKEDSKEKSRKHAIDYNGDLSEFLKFAIETKRIKAVRKEQYFV